MERSVSREKNFPVSFNFTATRDFSRSVVICLFLSIASFTRWGRLEVSQMKKVHVAQRALLPPSLSILLSLSFPVLSSPSNFSALPLSRFLPLHLCPPSPHLMFSPELIPLNTLYPTARISKLDRLSAVTILSFILTVHVLVFNSRYSATTPGLIMAKTPV